MRDWKQELRDRYEDYREQAPEGLWEAVSAEIVPSREKAFPRWGWLAVPAAAAAALVLLLPNGRSVDVPGSTASDVLVDVVPRQEPAPADSSLSLEERFASREDALVASAAPVVRKADERIPQSVPSREAMDMTKAGSEVTEAATEATEAAAEATEITAEATESAAKVTEDTAETSKDTADVTGAAAEATNVAEEVTGAAAEKKPVQREDSLAPGAGFPDPYTGKPVAERRQRSRSWSVGLVRSSGGTASVEQNTVGAGPVMSRRAASSTTGDPRTLAGLLTANQRTSSTERHEQIPSIGVCLSYNLDRNWSVESGAFFTCLMSEFNSGTESVYTLKNQEIYCVRIPVHLRYTLLQMNRLSSSLYAAGGASWIKGYELTRTEKVYIGGKEQLREENTSQPDYSLFSLDARLGLQVNVTRLLRFFTEAGASYNIQNDNALRTVLSEKPLSPSLSLGVRLEISPR